jgi:L-seryl-tRNA(Ser) seleniumtransferase
VRSGAALVLMSGDKLLGGPQAGIIVGRRAWVAACRKNPLARALRVDKLTLAALEATLALYRDPARAVREVPVLAMLTAPVAAVQSRAVQIAAMLRAAGIGVSIVDTEASVGGGAFPTARIASVALALAEGSAEAIERRLRAGSSPVIGRIADGRVLLDVRSIPPRDDAALAAAVVAALR